MTREEYEAKLIELANSYQNLSPKGSYTITQELLEEYDNTSLLIEGLYDDIQQMDEEELARIRDFQR